MYTRVLFEASRFRLARAQQRFTFNHGGVTSSRDLKLYPVIRGSDDIRIPVFRARHDDMIHGTIIRR